MLEKQEPNLTQLVLPWHAERKRKGHTERDIEGHRETESDRERQIQTQTHRHTDTGQVPEFLPTGR